MDADDISAPMYKLDFSQMKQKKTNIIKADLNAEFDQHINLTNLIGQDRACQILQTIVNQHHWDTIEQARHPIKPILLYSKHSCSTVARAISNSTGNTEFVDVVGQLIGFGVSLADQLIQIGDNITYHFSDIDKMVYYYKQPLHKLARDSILKLAEVPLRHKAIEERFSGLLILSLDDETEISSTMEKHCEAVIHLSTYKDEDIMKILEQRISLYGLMLEEQEKIVDAIVNVVHQDVRLAVKLLWWSWRCCRAEGLGIITLKHLNRTLKMWS